MRTRSTSRNANNASPGPASAEQRRDQSDRWPWLATVVAGHAHLNIQQLLQPDRQLADALDGCMEDRVGDRRSRTDIAKLANAFDAGRVHPIVLFGHENDL